MSKETTSFPFATSPDIIRSYQKDQYFQNKLFDQISTVSRNLKGVRATHLHSLELRHAADVIYLSLTTLLGNRTLGEEYCDILQIEAGNVRLPSFLRRSAYVLASVIFPYAFSLCLPILRRVYEGRGSEDNTEKGRQDITSSRLSCLLKRSWPEGLKSAFSIVNIYALNLAIFYFTGSYYHISKRLLRLRYVFAKRVAQTEQRVGYELLGVFLTLQLSVQMWLHIQDLVHNLKPKHVHETRIETARTAATIINVHPGTDTSISNMSTISQYDDGPDHRIQDVGDPTISPVSESHNVELSNPQTMSWITGRQQRKCTLCLDDLKNPSMTSCGHVFCWTCIGDWIKEKAECPLCRSNILMQHVLLLRN